MDDLLKVGVITSTHGLRGEVKVFPTTDDAQRFKKLKEVILDAGGKRCSLEIAGVRFFKQQVIVKFKGIDNINDVENYKGKSLYVTRDKAVRLEKDEYFIGDMLGMEVVSDEGEALGILKSVMETGANDVYVVEGSEKELLLPAIKQCILDVDIRQRKMTVHLMKGLR